MDYCPQCHPPTGVTHDRRRSFTGTHDVKGVCVAILVREALSSILYAHSVSAVVEQTTVCVKAPFRFSQDAAIQHLKMSLFFSFIDSVPQAFRLHRLLFRSAQVMFTTRGYVASSQVPPSDLKRSSDFPFADAWRRSIFRNAPLSLLLRFFINIGNVYTRYIHISGPSGTHEDSRVLPVEFEGQSDRAVETEQECSLEATSEYRVPCRECISSACRHSP